MSELGALRCILITSAALAFAACDAAMPAEPSRMMNVGTAATRDGLVALSGRVIDYSTGAVVPAASLRFRPFSQVDTAERAAIAGADGVYRVSLPAGVYLVTVDGVDTTALTVASPSAHSDILARAGACSALYGFVADARSGRPIPGAAVAAGGFHTTSDAAGWYRLDFGCGGNTGFGTTVAEFTSAGYERHVTTIGRGLPRGALRRDAGMLRPEAAP